MAVMLAVPIAAADADDSSPTAQRTFYEDSIDFWYEQDGAVYPGRMFAYFAADGEGAPGSLDGFVENELDATVAPAGVSAAYTYTGGSWPGGRHPAFTINPSAAPFGFTERQTIDAILMGADVWRYEGLEFTYAGKSTQFSNVLRPDGRFTVSFGANLPTEAIGIAIIWCIGCEGGPIEYDVQFRVGWTGWTFDQLVSTAAHEFGHVAGLGHEEHGCGLFVGPVMCPAAGSVFPIADDVAGITSIYGGGGPPLVPQPARYQASWAFAKGVPMFGEPVFAINPATGAICGVTTVKFEGGKPGFTVEAFGAFRSRPFCPEKGGAVRFYFPKQKRYSAASYPWSEGANRTGLTLEFTSLPLKYHGRLAGVAAD
jgi:hypothetical protein